MYEQINDSDARCFIDIDLAAGTAELGGINKQQKIMIHNCRNKYTRQVQLNFTLQTKTANCKFDSSYCFYTSNGVF